MTSPNQANPNISDVRHPWSANQENISNQPKNSGADIISPREKNMADLRLALKSAERDFRGMPESLQRQFLDTVIIPFLPKHEAAKEIER